MNEFSGFTFTDRNQKRKTEREWDKNKSKIRKWWKLFKKSKSKEKVKGMSAREEKR